MEQTHTTASATAPWRSPHGARHTAPAPTYADDAPLFDGRVRHVVTLSATRGNADPCNGRRRSVPPVMTADRAALAALHAPASIASRRAALAPAVSDQEWGTGSGMADPRTLPAQSSSCFA